MYWFGYLRPVNTARNPGKARISTLAAYGSAPDKKKLRWHDISCHKYLRLVLS